MTSLSPQQNVLPLYHIKREFVFSTWIEDSNPHTTTLLQSMVYNTACEANWLYLWGPHGSGLSHLTQALTDQLLQQKVSVFYLSLAQPDLSPDVLQDLASFDWIILDDIDNLLDQPSWQKALIELYHTQLNVPNKHLLLTSHTPPHDLTSSLLDLTTRLQSILALKVDPLNDEESLKKMLRKRAVFRQLTLPERSLDFLMHHSERTASHLIEKLNQLEQQSLIQKRPISIPFIKTLLNNG